MEDDFFIIDSNNLEDITTKLYGYGISNDGVILEEKKNYSKLSDLGAYVFVSVKDNQISIKQDYVGAYGIYIYRRGDYFALSNSFLKLLEYLRDKHENITFNHDYANYWMVETLVSNLTSATLVNEIEMLPRFLKIFIDVKSKTLNFELIPLKRYYVPINSKEALDILDSWFLKWVGLIRNIRKESNDIVLDLSGGFDSRAVAAIWFNAQIDLTKLRINSLDLERTKEDFEIVTEMANYLNFKINNDLNYNVKPAPIDESMNKSMCVKLGFEKTLFLRNMMPTEYVYRVCGHCGGMIKDYPNMNADEYMVSVSRSGYYFNPKFSSSCELLINEEYNKFSKIFDEEYLNNEFPSLLYREARCRHHFGKDFADSFLFNKITLAPLSDSDLQKIDYKAIKDIDNDNLLIALILKRYCPKLLEFRFESGRKIDSKTLEVCDKINNISPFTMPDYEFIEGPDIKITIPKKEQPYFNSNNLFYKIFDSKEFEEDFITYYPIDIYYKIKFDLYPKHRLKIRDVLSSIEIMKVINDINFANSIKPQNFVQWLRNFNISNYDNSSKIRSSILLTKYNQLRIDIKNYGDENNSLEILENSDDESKSNHHKWIPNSTKRECAITSSKSSLDLKLKVINDGVLRFKLRSRNVYDKDGKIFPIYLDCTRLIIDGKDIIKKSKLISFDNVFNYKMDVSDSQIVDIHIEWLPFNESNVYVNKEVESLKRQIQLLKKENKLLKEQNQSLNWE